MDAAIMRSGRGDVLNGNLVDYIVRMMVVHVVRRAMRDAHFFTKATGRSQITERDFQTGLVNAAHECFRIDNEIVVHARSTIRVASDGNSQSDGESDEIDEAEPADETESESESDSDEEFTTALDPALTGAARERAVEMKRRSYEWHAYAPPDPFARAVRNAVDVIIRRVQFHPARP